jgi:hypothetical protein
MIDASADEAADQLQKMHDLGLIIWYEAGGEKHTQLVSWWKFQPRRFAHPSKFPAPEGWKDRLRYHDPVTHKLVEVNWEGKPEKAKKSTEEDAGGDPYIGGLHREPTQGSYEGSEIHPYASASALALEDQNLLSEPPVSDGSNGDARKPSRKRISYPDAFKEFWNAYPRAVGKTPAFEAWLKVTKDGYPPEDILRATEEFARQMEREGRETSKIRYPERFLKKDFWKEFCFEEAPCSQS